MGSINIDVAIEDIIYAMGKYDRREFFEAMQDNEYISKSCVVTNDGFVEASSRIERRALDENTDEFNIALNKLFNNGWKLTKEQEGYIIELSKRF
jgi:hypothetical protein